MPKVPDYSNVNRTLKIIYNPKDQHETASIKQKNLLLTLYERHKLPTPNLSKMTKGEAAALINNILSPRTKDNDITTSTQVQ